MQKFLISTLVIIGLMTLPVANRFSLMLILLSSPTLLIEKQDEGPDVTWHDDYYILEWLDARTIAIAEPIYYQQNINYLILGDDRAILFDAGAGLRRILPVINSLTDKPLTFIPSHFHYDHLGDGLPFDNIAIVDLPHISNRRIDGQLTLQWHEHLGAIEGYTTPTFKVSEWLQPGGDIDLGNRKLEVIYTPGHTNDSISLYDPVAGFLFSGDFVYQGDLYAFLPNSSLGEYIQGSDNLLGYISAQTKIYGAHRLYPPGVPVLGLQDIEDLKSTLSHIREQSIVPSGIYPVAYPINDSLNLLAEPRPLQNWEITYPELSKTP